MVVPLRIFKLVRICIMCRVTHIHRVPINICLLHVLARVLYRHGEDGVKRYPTRYNNIILKSDRNGRIVFA